MVKHLVFGVIQLKNGRSKAPGNKFMRQLQWLPKKTDLPTCHMDKSSWCLHCENAYKSWITDQSIYPPRFCTSWLLQTVLWKSFKYISTVLCCSLVQPPSLQPTLPHPERILSLCHHFSGILDLLKVVGKTKSQSKRWSGLMVIYYGRIHKESP